MYQFGKVLRFDLFGKSHAECVGGILEGLPKGFSVDFDMIAGEMALRKPSDGIGTPRKEEDRVEFLQGLKDGVADGNPILFKIANKDTDGSKYLKFKETPRPGHADLPALTRYPDHDIRGGGQFSGRLTAAIVAAGAIAKQFNGTFGISVSAHTASVGEVKDVSERSYEESLKSRIYPTRACTEELDRRMFAEIRGAGEAKDSVGGIVECIAIGLPIGFGGIWFDALDAEIAKAMFGIPACKGVEFGKGFGLAEMKGSQSNDQFFYDNGIKTKTNNMGGILGGMSNGAPMVFRTVFKPTPSIGLEQNTVNLKTMSNDKVTVTGRHDPCIVPRAVSVVEAMTNLVIADFILREKTPPFSGAGSLDHSK